jgi:hypothetical protein
LSKVRTTGAENGVRSARVWAGLLGVEKTVVERVEFDEGEAVIVASVRPARGQRRRCGVCRRRSPGYDRGEGRRRWRALDLGRVRVFVEADAPRVCCPVHGVVVAAVPWARHGVGHTLAFDQTVAWLATVCSKSAVTELMRIAWRSVGAIVARVWADTAGRTDLLAGLRRIGIDEISYRKGHKYLLVVVDHDTGRLVWAGKGADQASLTAFFTQLGPARCAQMCVPHGLGVVARVPEIGPRPIRRGVRRLGPAAPPGAEPWQRGWFTVAALEGDLPRRYAWPALYTLADPAQAFTNLFVGRGPSRLIWKFECRAMAIPGEGEAPASDARHVDARRVDLSWRRASWNRLPLAGSTIAPPRRALPARPDTCTTRLVIGARAGTAATRILHVWCRSTSIRSQGRRRKP